MEQYIPKSKVIEEIKSYKDNFCDRNGYLEDVETNGLAYDTLCELENSIDALEAKEVDLNKEIEDYVEQHKSELSGYFDIRRIARHFFALGMLVSNKTKE